MINNALQFFRYSFSTRENVFKFSTKSFNFLSDFYSYLSVKFVTAEPYIALGPFANFMKFDDHEFYNEGHGPPISKTFKLARWSANIIVMPVNIITLAIKARQYYKISKWT